MLVARPALPVGVGRSRTLREGLHHLCNSRRKRHNGDKWMKTTGRVAGVQMAGDMKQDVRMWKHESPVVPW